MTAYRSLLLGCGPRAVEHADVYGDLPDMELVALCDRIPERREQFRERFGVAAVFAEYEEALAAVQPDIVHLVTQPTDRVGEIEAAARAGVRAVIVEKPMAVMPSELEALRRLRAGGDMEIIQNCQRRYFPQFRDGEVRDIVRQRLGQVYFVRASTRGNGIAMGPHLLDLLMLLLGEAQPESVWAMASGLVETGYEESHRAPQHLLAEYTFPGDLRAVLDCSPQALGTPGEDSFWMHLHLGFLGTEGRLFVTQNRGYWYQARGMSEPVSGDSSWDRQKWQGQRDFTAAVGDWLSGGAPHLNRFELSYPVIDALLAAQRSAYLNRRLDLPTAFTDAEWNALRERLRSQGPL